MRIVPVIFVGFGNVARALVALMRDKQTFLAQEYGIEVEVAGVWTLSLGCRVTKGIGLEELTPVRMSHAPAVASFPELLQVTGAQVLFEMSSLNPQTGEPALSVLRQALLAGAHVVTANKGPVVHGYSELSALSRRQNREFLFEATCLAGAPFFSLFRETRPGCCLVEFRGIVNVTANLILREMEQGKTFAEGVERTQDLGLAETDPSNDVDGWDAAVKIAIVASVLMGQPTTPADVRRRGIRDVTPADLAAARAAGRRVRLVVRAWQEQGRVLTSVAPEALELSDPLVAAGADALIGECITDTIPPFTVAAAGITPTSTAYDVWADFVHILHGL